MLLLPMKIVMQTDGKMMAPRVSEAFVYNSILLNDALL